MTENDSRGIEKIPVSSKIWLGGADCMITTLCNIITGGGLTFFFVNYFGMDPSWSAACWLIFGIWNAVNDPLFGYISDRTRSKLGRRIPYIRYGSLVIAAVFVLSWVTFFDSGSNVQMFIQMLTSLFIFDALYTMIATSLYVMPFEMAITNEARSRILLVKVIFGFIALSVPLVLLAKLEAILDSSLRTFQLLMTGIGIFAGGIMFISSFFYRESKYIQHEEQYPFLKSLITCFKNRSFIAFEIISFSITFIQTALMIGLSYYFESNGIGIIPCYAAMFVGIIFGMVLWSKLSIKWDVKKSIVMMCWIFGGGLIFMLALGFLTVGGIVGFFCAGIGFSGGMYLIPLMNGDVIDYDEHISGLRREGMYAGVNSFICKPAISIANAAFPAILSCFGYDSGLALNAQSSLAVFGIRFAWLAVSGLLLIICAIGLQLFYPLYGRKWREIKDGLRIVHEKKYAAYTIRVMQEAAEEEASRNTPDR